jgi:hypothetical protein
MRKKTSNAENIEKCVSIKGLHVMTCCFDYVDFKKMLIIFIKIQKPHRYRYICKIAFNDYC